MTRRAHTVIPRVGSVYRPLRPLKSSAEPFSILISLRDNRYRCLDLTDPRSTTAVRTTSNVGACPVVPPSHCGYRQGEPSPYLVSRVLLAELDFRGLVTLARYAQGPSTPVTSVVPSLSFPTIYLSWAPLGRPTSYLKDNRYSGPYGGKTKSASSGVQGLLLDSSHLR